MITSGSVSFTPSLQQAYRDLGLTDEQQKQANQRALRAMGAWMVREMQVATTSRGQKQPGATDMWLPLSDAWLATKAEEGRSQLIGLYEGRMRDSMSFDIRMSQLEVEAGPTVEHAASFDSVRPITPDEEYAAKHFQDVTVAEWSRG